jgi:hypothetical protein
VVVLARAAGGQLSELPGPAGCVNGDGSGGCTAARALLPGCCGIAISPDSRSVYLSSWEYLPAASPAGSDSAAFALSAFSRDGAGGGLAQLPGAAGCVNKDGSAGCAAAAFAGSLQLNTSGDIVISPNGRSVYLAHSSAFPAAEAGGCGGSDSFLALFPRDPAGGALGPLAQDIGSCGGIPALSPDGKSLYATTGNFGNVLSLFSRDRQTGSLSHAGCIGQVMPGCRAARHFPAPSTVAVTPNGRYVYAISDDPGFGETIAVFRRSLR